MHSMQECSTNEPQKKPTKIETHLKHVLEMREMSKKKLIQIYIKRSKNAVQHAHKSVTSLTFFREHFHFHFFRVPVLVYWVLES
jgi:hypothetical protein